MADSIKQYALITGAGSGIGLATAELFIKNSWNVIAVGRTASKLEELRKKYPQQILAIECDLAKASDVAQLIAKLSEQKLISQIKALVNNAGIWKRVSFFESDDQLWQTQFETNVLGSVRLTRDLLKLSIKENIAVSVVNISSTLGIRPVADTAAYSASKAAMVSWTQTLALEVASKKIRVNCICPGIIDTPIHDFHKETTPEMKELRASLQNAQPLGRMGRAEDVAAGVLYFCSNGAEWITGTTLNIDGGISL